MKRKELNDRLTSHKTTTHDALQLIWDNTVKGQQKQLLKNAEIKELLDRYEVVYE